MSATILGLVRLIHPAPAVAVIALSAALGAILSAQAALPVLSTGLLLTTVAVAGSQVLTGALNDWADRDRDRIAQPTKPIPSGAVTTGAALALAIVGASVQLAASVPLAWLALGLGAAASVSAVAYDLWLSRTPLSVVPYVVSFGLLPLWIAAGVGVGLERVAGAALLVGPFAAAAHLANALRDFDADARLGSRNLAQTLGARAAHATAFVLAIGVGIGVGAALVVGGNATPISLVFGLAGLVVLIPGARSASRLWSGMLFAAVLWTVAWALATA